MKLTVILDELFYWDGKYHSSLFSAGKFMQYFLPYFKEITICAPTQRVKCIDPSNYAVTLEKIGLRGKELPSWKTLKEFLQKLPANMLEISGVILRSVKESEIIWIKLPSIVGIIGFFFAKVYHKPLVLDIGGNAKEAWRRFQYQGVYKILVKIGGFILHKITSLMINYALTLLTGEELYRLYGKNKRSVLFTRTLFEERDIFHRQDTCQKETIKLLYVGKIIADKGIFCLLGATKNLLEEGYNIYLTIVGFGPEEEELKRKIEDLNISKNVEFKEYIPFGRRLLQIYRNADVFIMSSIHFEGFPRVILEAMGAGLPVLATNIGGVSGIIKNNENGIIIKPNSQEDICRAVKELIQNPKLRRKIIRNSLYSIKQHTAEVEVKKVINAITKFYYQSKKEKVYV